MNIVEELYRWMPRVY